MEIDTKEVFGFIVCDSYTNDLAGRLARHIDQDQPVDILTIFAINPNKVILAAKDPQVTDALQSAGILVPDGIGVVIASKLMGRPLSSRIAGVDLFESLSLQLGQSCPVFFYGAKPGVAARAAEQLKAKNPDLSIAGVVDGYSGDEMSIIDKVNGSGAKALFVGLGSPAQELFINRNANLMPCLKLAMGVGGSFDAISGEVGRAPQLAINMHLEWAYRILSQPARLRNSNLVAFCIFAAKQIAKTRAEGSQARRG
ncbi:MAG: WecB/TagA/CpsF family glycosyltransferase [Eubacteriaceae bacterium]|nr:WecB/TagA/CpsF family glycosyltransferase [Eubacteriaceae bacterium]